MIAGCCNAPLFRSPLNEAKAISIWELEDPSDKRKVYFLSKEGAEQGKVDALKQRAEWFVRFLKEHINFRIVDREHWSYIVGVNEQEASVSGIPTEMNVSANAPVASLPDILKWLDAGCPEEDMIKWTNICHPDCEHTIQELKAYP